MDVPLNSPLTNPASQPDFGNSILDAFNRMGAEADEGVSTPVTEEPKKAATPPASETAKPASKSEKDIERLFGSSKKQTVAAAEVPTSTDADSDIPETIKSTKAADAFRKIKEEKAQLAKQLAEMKAETSSPVRGLISICAAGGQGVTAILEA